MNQNDRSTEIRWIGCEGQYTLEQIKERLDALYERSSQWVAPERRDDCPVLKIQREVIDAIQKGIDGDTSVLDAMLAERRK